MTRLRTVKLALVSRLPCLELQPPKASAPVLVLVQALVLALVLVLVRVSEQRQRVVGAVPVVKV